jgi:hypothetical protein
MKTICPGFIRSRRYYSPFLRIASYHHWFTPEIGIEYLLYGDKKGV